MNDYFTLWMLLFFLFCSAFFSGSETALMALNKYRLQHLARSKKDKKALRLLNILEKPQRLLSMILIGNTFMNMLISSFATSLTLAWYGDDYIMVVVAFLTIIVLIFAEIIPKTIAAYNADVISYAVGWFLEILLYMLYPLIIIINFFTDFVLRLISPKGVSVFRDYLSKDEIKSLIVQKRSELGSNDNDFKNMLVGVLDLDEMTVNDIMVPRSEIRGVNIEESLENILLSISSSISNEVVVYRESAENILGFLDLHTVIDLQKKGDFNKKSILDSLSLVNYIPEGTLLGGQLRSFQQQKYNVGVVVDEYGQTSGLVCLEDIVEEIIGDFSVNSDISLHGIVPKGDGTYWVKGALAVRDINKFTNWSLPEDGPNTLSGLIVERLECIPEGECGLVVQNYRIEILKMKKNKVYLVKISMVDYVVKG